MIARPIVHNLHEALLKISPEPYAKSCSSTGRSSRPPLHLRQPRTRQEVDRKREQNRSGRSPTRKAARTQLRRHGLRPDPLHLHLVHARALEEEGVRRLQGQVQTLDVHGGQTGPSRIRNFVKVNLKWKLKHLGFRPRVGLM